MIKVEGRNVAVIYVSEAAFIDYDEIVEESYDELVTSVATGRMQVYFQYDGSALPAFVSQLSYFEGPYDYDTFQQVLLHSTWSGQDSALDDTSMLLIDEARY